MRTPTSRPSSSAHAQESAAHSSTTTRIHANTTATAPATGPFPTALHAGADHPTPSHINHEVDPTSMAAPQTRRASTPLTERTSTTPCTAHPRPPRTTLTFHPGPQPTLEEASHEATSTLPRTTTVPVPSASRESKLDDATCGLHASPSSLPPPASTTYLPLQPVPAHPAPQPSPLHPPPSQAAASPAVSPPASNPAAAAQAAAQLRLPHPGPPPAIPTSRPRVASARRPTC